ncbi:SufE family protein [Lysobacter soyae]|uniref:SufE family protein n=1 Tax=Lysobacter soyae TaxID=2764185 RepID=A0ABX8WLM8_9GAMM|nr:SufE family protein [Lysobacter sp. CJ11]QYR52289.1 SufE family protein [Lysobacter sp. CJ11]
MSQFPMEATTTEAQAAIADEFSLFSDWSERYQYLIDLGKKLPPLDDAFKTDQYRLHGCQSNVWITDRFEDGLMHFEAASDSTIVSGLIFLALRVYSGRTPEAILSTTPDYVRGIGLERHLSPTRSNGHAALLQFIQDRAGAAR